MFEELLEGREKAGSQLAESTRLGMGGERQKADEIEGEELRSESGGQSRD